MGLILALFFALVAVSHGDQISGVTTNRTVVKELTVGNGGNYGYWTDPEFCPRGSFASGYNMKIEDNQFAGDDTALNAIKLICTDKSGHPTGNGITSGQGSFGDWGKTETCNQPYHSANFLTAFTLQVEKPQGGGDDTSANFVKFYCRDLAGERNETVLYRPPGTGHWGTYGEWSESCANGTAICGLTTKIESVQNSGDDTSLNDVVFYCCEESSQIPGIVG
ncbi:vitelline membrane outer layer protein 1-like [Ruditapes philippinarum]|uniref:vitelline membrane outer layer protein 1-like n=1 Tax=Ruditapes philippinarum TaxID=129788 RepID=UPI00295A8A45|nr:vitelline membrane outer layer protein 1-like [Ruditapes philippinarum]